MSCIGVAHQCKWLLPGIAQTLILGVQGFCPPVQAALDLYRMLSEPGVDLRQPVRLENQLLVNNVDMDTEVGQSMLQLLQVLLPHYGAVTLPLP